MLVDKKPNKIKLLTMGDHPLVPSGVGTQCRYLFEGLLATGRYQILSLGGAINHENMQPVKVEPYNGDWIIVPTVGYGSEEILRQFIDLEKPDVIWFMTDPRFFGWLFNMSDELKNRGIPLLYNHVWDDLPVPKFNKGYYQSCDFVGCISKLTHHILCELGMQDKSDYIPHAVDANIFNQLSKEEILSERAKILGPHKDKFVVFYNSRNARRKMTSDVLKTFKMFMDQAGAQDNAFLLMHADPRDPEGANLLEVAPMLGIRSDQLSFSVQKFPPDVIAKMYNIADVTINISNNEGFGLSCLESMSSGTPVIVNKTGGLQDQPVDDQGNVFGVLVEPAVRSLTGSQEIPYIFDDRCADKDIVDALIKMYNMSWDERKELGKKAREWTLKAFSMKNMIDKWDAVVVKYVERYKQKGSERIRSVKI